MSNRTVLTELQYEGTTPYLEFDIESELDVGFKPETLHLTLFDAKSGTIINSRNNVSVIDSCDSNGHVAMWLEAEDLAMSDPVTNRTETRRALFRWTWAAGARVGAHEIEFPIMNHLFLPVI